MPSGVPSATVRPMASPREMRTASGPVWLPSLGEVQSEPSHKRRTPACDAIQMVWISLFANGTFIS